ncbi:MAG: hypothetical protein U5N21_17560 [Rhodococcus sp. (in: high G+C Gram-positive bacteria)]|nr:hypothetical protein [Rhodococcus sp. (in: high G+C Gram-positive bacteria)]
MTPTTLDQTDTIRRSRRDELTDLASDLTAAALTPNGRIDIAAIHNRPTILRRLAALLAEHLTPDIDRIVATNADTALATALSLHSGIPFVTLTGTGAVQGELHPSERVAIIATTSNDDARTRMAGTLDALAVETRTDLTALSTSIHDTRYVYRLSDDSLQSSQEQAP